MTQVILSLLGPFRVMVDGELANHFESNKARALLAYLAAETGRTCTRTSLADLFWPESAESTAHGYLRRTLSNLRAVLKERIAASPILHIARDTVQFTLNGTVDVDLLHFLALTDGLDRTAASVTMLEQAVMLYRGPFLDGLAIDECPAFEHWLTVLRSNIEQRAGQSLFHLAQRYAELGRRTDALELLRRHLELNELNEEAHRLLMQLLMLLGERSAALAHYNHLCHLLGSELGMAPEAATQAIYQDIQRGAPASAPTLADRLAQATQPSFLPVPVCVGRDQQLAQLDTALERMLRADGRAVFLTGEAGVGKTTLLQTFLQRARQLHPEIKVGYGVCTAHIQAGGDTFQAFPGMLRSLLETGEHNVSADKCRLAPSDRAPSAEVRELLHTTAPDWVKYAPPPSTARFDQFLVFLQQLTVQTPVVLAIDNLQWADPPAIALIFHLIQHLRGARVLLLGAYRPTPSEGGGVRRWRMLRASIDELAGSSLATLIDLDGLDNWGIMNAMLDLEANHLDGEFRTNLMKHTEGHPLFTAELLQALRAQGSLVCDSDGCWIAHAPVDWALLPSRAAALIDERILFLTPETRRLLDTASVEGDEFTAEVLAYVHGLPTPTVIDLLSRELAGKHKLVLALEPIGDGGTRLLRYRFRHHWVRQYLYAHLDAAERAQAHNIIGQALEMHSQQPGRRLAGAPIQLAQHFELAKEHGKAISYWRIAGKQLANHGMLHEAIDSLTHALRLIPAEDAQKRFDLLFDREHLYDLIANRDGQTRDLAELQRLAAVTGREDWRALAHLRRANLAETTAQYNIALTEARAAAALAQTAGDAALRAAALRLMGRAAWWQGSLWRSRRYYTQALAAAEQAGAAPLILDSLIHLGIACWSLDDLEAARTCFRRVDREAEAASVQAITAELGSGVIAAAAGSFNEADHKLTYSLELSVNLGWLWVEVQARLHLAGLLRRSQQFERFFANHATLLRQCEQVGDPWLTAAALYEAAAAHRSLGAWAQALTLARTALERANTIGATLVKVLALNTAAQTHLELGDPVLAHPLTDQSLSLAARLKTPSILIATLLIRSTVLRRLHLFDEATDALLQARSAGWNEVSRRYLPDLLAAQAAIALEQGQLDVACALVEGLLTDFDAATIARADSPADVYLSCYRVLHAAHNPWAALPLSRAYHLIRACAATIANPQQRRSYQENVTAHREIIALYDKAA